MEIKEIMKLDKQLGSNYWLMPLMTEKGQGWLLMRAGSLRAILNSEENTEEQLRKFVKEHRMYDMRLIMPRTTLIINLVILALCIVNLFIKSTLLTMFICGSLITLVPMIVIQDIVIVNNKEIASKVFNEDADYAKKMCLQTTKEEKKTKRTKTKVGSTTTKRRKPKTKGEEKKEI